MNLILLIILVFIKIFLIRIFVAVIFAAAGTYQMTVWAIGKHRNYRKEFDRYPRERKAIIPFLI